MKRILPAILGVWMGGFALFGQSEEAREQPREAKQETMPLAQFSKTHAPLFSAPKSNDAGSLTEHRLPAYCSSQRRPQGLKQAPRFPERGLRIVAQGDQP